MKVDLSFESHYSIEILEELGAEERYYYPNATTEGGKDGLMIEVISEQGKSWVGIFAFGDISHKGVSGVFTMPDPDKLCVVSMGAGYIVSSSDPTNWEEVKSIPITGVHPVKLQDVLVFADYTELVAYNKSGIKWRTERLAYDSFKVIEVTDTYLKGEFWNMRNEANESFEVDLLTGSQVGGIKEV